MCGLYGIIDYGQKMPPHIKEITARILGVLNETRGTDASGFCYLDKAGIKTIVKGNEAARKLDFSLLRDATAIIGHTRKATIGGSTELCAHPFDYRNWVSTHNGMIHAWHEKNPWVHGSSKVDSESLLRYMVYKGGVTPDNLKHFEEVWKVGSYAVACLSDANIFYAFRDTSPLYYAIIDGILIYSSEENHLLSALIFTDQKLTDSVKMLAPNEYIEATEAGIAVHKYKSTVTSHTYEEIKYNNPYSNNRYNRHLYSEAEWPTAGAKNVHKKGYPNDY